MKRRDLVKQLESFGCELVRHGAKHDWYRNPNTGVSQPVPRHREVNEHLARHIIQMLNNPEPGEGSEGQGSAT
jgi:predicted RNA binding protein YcfA (HicA-like mRNA interferase family)